MRRIKFNPTLSSLTKTFHPAGKPHPEIPRWAMLLGACTVQEYQRMKRLSVLVGGILLTAPLAALAFSESPPPFDNDGVITKAEWANVVALGAKGGVIDLGQQRVEFQRARLQPSEPLILRGGQFSAITLDQWQNVTFEGSVFRPASTDNPDGPMVLAYDPQNLTFDRVNMSGKTLADGKLVYPSIGIRGGSNITVRGSRFWNMTNSMYFVRTNGVRVEHNDFTNIREGVQLVAVQNAVVRGNAFGPYLPYQGDHADGVQLFTAGMTQTTDTGARNVVIDGNLVISSSTGRAQGVFIRDEAGLFRSGRGYAGITVANNLLVGTGWHGVGVMDPVQGLTIDNNRLLVRNGSGDTVTSNWIMVKSIDFGGSAVVTNNQSGSISLAAGVQQSNNTTLQPVSDDVAKQAIDEWFAVNRQPVAPTTTAPAPTKKPTAGKPRSSRSTSASSRPAPRVTVRRGSSTRRD